MKIFKLEASCDLPISVDEAWEFFSNPKNLSTITPPGMSFTITNNGGETPMYQGMLITYIVKPLLGIPMNWVTEITTVKHKEFFIDEQRFGPYKFWHHQHFFEAIPGGTRVRDIVHYGIPLGILGRMVKPILVEPKLNEIFKFREQKMVELFGKF